MLRNSSLSIDVRLTAGLLQLFELYNAWSVGKDQGCATDFMIREDRVADLLLEWKRKSSERVFVVEIEASSEWIFAMETEATE